MGSLFDGKFIVFSLRSAGIVLFPDGDFEPTLWRAADGVCSLGELINRGPELFGAASGADADKDSRGSWKRGFHGYFRDVGWDVWKCPLLECSSPWEVCLFSDSRLCRTMSKEYESARNFFHPDNETRECAKRFIGDSLRPLPRKSACACFAEHSWKITFAAILFRIL